jgi:hypothetical protein
MRIKELISVIESIEATDDPNNPLIFGHQGANPATLKDRISRSRAQLKALAEMASSDDIGTWEQICSLVQGSNLSMGLVQNIEQVRHGIEELTKYQSEYQSLISRVSQPRTTDES